MLHGSRIVIPKALQDRAISIAHKGWPSRSGKDQAVTS